MPLSLSRAATLAADDKALQTELTNKGMHQKRIDTVISLAATRSGSNTKPEANKK